MIGVGASINTAFSWENIFAPNGLAPNADIYNNYVLLRKQYYNSDSIVSEIKFIKSILYT